MPVIVEANIESAELFLSVSGVGTTIVPTLEELKRALATSPDEYAVVIGPSADLTAAAGLADTLRVTRPALSVILVRRRVDTSVLAEALRSGMREVVEERDLTGLGAAVQRAQQIYRAVTGPVVRPADARNGRLVTIFSPKGGVGKTTIAANLAVSLTDRHQAKVCLVDLDLGFGDIAITLQLFPARTIADVVALESGLDFAVLEPLLTPHRRGFTTLVAPVQPDAKDSIPASLVSRVLQLLKENFDYVIVDTSPSFDEHILQAFDESDELLLVTTLDVPTLKNVKIANETLDLLNFPESRRRLVLNRADDRVGLTAEKVEATLGMQIVEAIPTSSEVGNSTNAGEPITASHPKHPVSLSLHRIADAVSGVARTDSAESAPASTAPRRGFLRRGAR